MARSASAWCPGGRVAPNPEPRSIPCSTTPIAAPARETLERVEIARRMHPLELVAGRGPPLDPGDRRRQVGRAQRGEDRLNPLGALGMAGARVVPAGSRVGDDGHGHYISCPGAYRAAAAGSTPPPRASPAARAPGQT